MKFDLTWQNINLDLHIFKLELYINWKGFKNDSSLVEFNVSRSKRQQRPLVAVKRGYYYYVEIVMYLILFTLVLLSFHGLFYCVVTIQYFQCNLPFSYKNKYVKYTKMTIMMYQLYR